MIDRLPPPTPWKEDGSPATLSRSWQHRGGLMLAGVVYPSGDTSGVSCERCGGQPARIYTLISAYCEKCGIIDRIDFSEGSTMWVASGHFGMLPTRRLAMSMVDSILGAIHDVDLPHDHVLRGL